MTTIARPADDLDRDERRRRRRPLVLLGFAALAAISLSTGAASLALFTSQATVPANAFTAGTLVLTTSPTTALITLAAMAPGDVVTAPLTVSNTGTLDLRYAATSAATNADGKGLAAALSLTIKSGVTTCTNAGFASSGTQIYSGVLGTVVASPLFGDSAQGAQAGDRALAASANEVLCFQASLPIGTGNVLQGATTTATFTFYGEQTKNN
jgi:predicted ribosomally synthesized peptide with SipW-like signal peptide